MTSEGYERGYADGESNQLADWQFALEVKDGLLPEDVEIAPTPVAAYIAGLQSLIRDLASSSPYDNRGGGDCVFCGIDLYFAGSDPTGHLDECPWRRAKELTQRVEGVADPRAETDR